MLGNVFYIVIGTILGLLVITMLMVGLICYCKRRATRQNVHKLTNQTSEADFTNAEEQFEEISLSEEITLEKTNEPDVILCTSRPNTEELRNVYSEEPKLGVILNNESEIKSVPIQGEEVVTTENNGDLTDYDGQYEDMSDAECGYSTIDDLSGDESGAEDESEYHCIDGFPSSAQSDTDSLYTVINDLFDLPPEGNYYLSLYGGSDDDDNNGSENSDIYYRISTDLSDDGSDHYTFIHEWESTDTLNSSIAISEDENGYLLITGNTPVSSKENLTDRKEDDENDNNKCEINEDGDINNDNSVFISMPFDQTE